MKIWAAPSTRTCFKNAIPLAADSEKITICAARGEYVSAQILLRNVIHDTKTGDKIKDNILKITKININQRENIRKYDISQIRIQAQEYVSFADEIAYPDALCNDYCVKLYPNVTQGIWVTFPVDSKVFPGEYNFTVEVVFDSGECANAEILLVVFDVEIPPSQKGRFSIEHFQTPEEQIMLDHAGYKCKAFDDKWWQFMKEYARSLRECRSNVYRIYPLELLRASGSRRISHDKWHFDFSIFDKMVSLLLEEKVAKYFSINDPLIPLSGKEMYALDENANLVLIDIYSEDFEIWVREYFTALHEHIKQFGGTDMWIMHIQDEPRDASTWLRVKEYVDRYIPKIRCGNPFDQHTASEISDAMDIYIPLFPMVDKHPDFYKKASVDSSKEVWPYCCCYPDESWYLNRFIDRPAIQTRLIGWATFSQGFSGFLHYGYSFWQKTAQFYPYGTEKFARFKGDCMIIYPSPEDNSYRISVRYINLRDGAQDFELLKILEDNDKEKALEIASRIARGYANFNTNERDLFDARYELLKLCEGIR